MAKIRVRVLYPAAFPFDTQGSDEIDVDEPLARHLIASGWAEALIEVEVKRGPGRPKKETL